MKILALILLLAGLGFGSEDWMNQINHGVCEELQTQPEIVPVKTEDHSVTIEIKNASDVSITYFGSDHSIQEFTTVEKDGKWILENWDWCGTGKKNVIIQPNESKLIIVSLPELPGVRRIYGRFTRGKLASFVLLYQTK